MSNSATPWTVACQAPLSMGFSRQEHWSGLPCPPPGDLPNAGTEPTSLLSLVFAGGFFTTSATWEAPRSQGSQQNKLKIMPAGSGCSKRWIWLRSPCVWNWPLSQGKGFDYKCMFVGQIFQAVGSFLLLIYLVYPTRSRAKQVQERPGEDTPTLSSKEKTGKPACLPSALCTS